VTGDQVKADAKPKTGDDAIERALHFRVGRAHLLLRLDRVARVIEVPCAPLPLTRPLVLGLGYDEDRPVVCVSLTKTRPSRDNAVVKAVLLTTTARVGWALCIDEVFTLVTVTQLERAAASNNLPPWVGRARTPDGRTLGWIDADVMVSELSEPEGGR